MTPEMVYAIHSFQAIRGDELDFEYGEPIIVLEKDDMYGDGWWQGRNIRGKIGLFPKSYASYNKPRRSLDSVARPDSSKIDVIDFNEPNLTIDDTIDDLQNKLQVMINNSNKEDSSKKQKLRKRFSSISRLSNSSTSASSYFSATINSEVNSPRNSLYRQQPPQIIIDSDHTKSHKNPKGHPLTWDVQQVCQWLSENSFNSEKKHFIENDVTGDVLLDLNLHTLKEINIISFGKRVHIMNTITSLKEQYSMNDQEAQSLTSKSYTESQFSGSDTSRSYSFSTADESFSETPSDSQRPLKGSNNQINDQKSNINPASYYSSPPSSSEQSEKPKMAKKSSRIFLKLGSFGKSNNTKPKIDKSRLPSPSTGGWDFNMDDGRREKEKRLLKNKHSVYEELLSTSSEPEKSISLKFIPGRRQKKSSLDRKALVGNRLGLPKDLLENASNSYYSDNNVNHVEYVDEDDELLKSIGIPDYEGWLKKQGDKYKSWKSRFCILKGSTLYYLKSDKTLQTSRVKGQINLAGYRVVPDENVYQGKYGFKLIHDTERPYFFVHEDLEILKGWMKAIMKATIERDITVPITSSSYIPTVPLSEARKVANRMHPSRSAPPTNISVDNSIISDILPLTPTFSNLPPRPAPTPPITPTFSNLQSRPAFSPPITPTFSNLPPRHAPSPPINNEKSTITIPLSSVPKPKAPPAGAPPPRPKPSNLNLNSYKVIKSTSPEPLSPRFGSQIPNSPNRMGFESSHKKQSRPKFPSMSISIPAFPPANNKYSGISMGGYV